MDEVYPSLAYEGAPLLRVPVCVSRVLFVHSVVLANMHIVQAMLNHL